MLSNRFIHILIPVISVFLGLIAGAIIMLLSGYNPLAGYAALWNGAFGDLYFAGETVRQITPYILSGLAVALAFRAGLFNIGVEGQVFMGWLASVWVGVSMDLPMVIHLPLAILAGALAGGLWGFIPGILKAKLYVHEVIVSIMLNYTALYIANSVIRNVITDQQDSTERVAESASFRSQWLDEVTGYSSIHFGFIVALISVFLVWFLLNKTTKGYELRAVGYNQHASRYSGMKVDRNIILAMVYSGALAGVAGTMQGLGTFEKMSVQSGFTNIGFDGIAVALIGGNTAIGVVLGAILFGVLKVGALNMPLAGVPTELVEIVIALIIFFVASGYIIRWALNRIERNTSKKVKEEKTHDTTRDA